MATKNTAALLLSDSVSCAVCKDGKIYTDNGIGVKPLMSFIRRDRRFFSGAIVADKIIGKAAAMLLIYSGAAEIYGEIMSENAVGMLELYGIPYSYGMLVPFIRNRAGDGLCPLEQAVKELRDPAQAFDALETRIAELMTSKE